MGERALPCRGQAARIALLGLALGMAGPPLARANADLSGAAPDPDATSVVVLIGNLAGQSTRYEFRAGGGVTYEDGWTQRRLVLAGAQVNRLVRRLVAGGLCTLQPPQPLLPGASKRMLYVAVVGGPAACHADLPMERWRADARARECLRRLRAAMRPLARACAECTLP